MAESCASLEARRGLAAKRKIALPHRGIRGGEFYNIARPPAQRFRGRACSSTVGGRPRWSPELAAGLRERRRAENRAARRSQSTAERPTSTARSTCDKSGPVRPLRGLEGRTSSGWNGLKLGDRARAQCAPPRRVLLPPARTAAMLRTNGTNAPTHARAHRRRPSKRRAMPSRSRAALAAPAGAPAMQRRPVQREGQPPLPGRPNGRGASGERGAPCMLSAGADASRSGMVPSDGRAARVVIGTHRRNCIARPRVPRGRVGKSGATRPRLLAAAAAQLAAEHGARRRAQLRPAPLPLFHSLALCGWVPHEHSRIRRHTPAGHAGAGSAVFALMWGL